MKKNVLLFNPVSVVHDRNIQIFSRAMPDLHSRAIYNPNFRWFSNREKVLCPNAFFFQGKLFPRPPENVFDGVTALILFTAQPRVPPSTLIEEAFVRKIPVIAIEEVSQMMLSQGAMNNYVLPVDHFLVASEYEKAEFLKQGSPLAIIKTVGGVFRYKDKERTKKASKADFGLDPLRPVATLSLDLLAPNGETPLMRQRILEILLKGLPEEYQVLVKPHPAEKEESVARFLGSRGLSRARIAPSLTSIECILDVTDILFNRGTSQVIIDAIQRDIPVIPVPVGRRTVFEGLLDDIIVKKEDDVPRVIELVRKKGIGIYGEIINRHLAITPGQAVQNTVGEIRKIVDSGICNDEWIKWTDLALLWAWMGYPSRSLRALGRISEKYNMNKEILCAMKSLIAKRARRQDLILLKNSFTGQYAEWILKSLWIDTAYSAGASLSHEDVKWLKDFPPKTNKFHFLRFALKLGWLYRISGYHNEAFLLAEEMREAFGSENGVVGSLRTRLDHTFKAMVKNIISR